MLVTWNTSPLSAEIARWKKWEATSARPGNAIESMEHCDPDFYNNIHRLLDILAVLPVTTATAETSFSTLRRLKAYLRSKRRSTQRFDAVDCTRTSGCWRGWGAEIFSLSPVGVILCFNVLIHCIYVPKYYRTIFFSLSRPATCTYKLLEDYHIKVLIKQQIFHLFFVKNGNVIVRWWVVLFGSQSLNIIQDKK